MILTLIHLAHDRILEIMWRVFPFTRPHPESARRFVGRISWNGLRINKQEMMHSLAFRSSNWIDLIGFEMLSSDQSFQMTFTITKGQGVLGRIVSKGRAFVPPGNILHPSRVIRLRSPQRLQPNSWYCINAILEIHEYEMYLTTSAGTEGLASVTTDGGVRIDYAPGLESCPRTNIRSGQIAGIVLRRIDPNEEDFLVQEGSEPVQSCGSTCSVREASAGDSMPVLPGHAYDVPQASPVPSSVIRSSNPALPPLAGVMTVPIRTEQALRHIPTYKY